MAPQLAAARLAVRRANMRKNAKRALLALPPLYLITWCNWAGLTRGGAPCTRS